MKYLDSNLINKKFNRWTILEFTHKYNRTYYICKCECGNIKDIKPSHLFKGLSKSCGCLLKDTPNHRKGCISEQLLPDNLGAKKRLHTRYKSDAKRRNVAFDISIDDFIKIAISNCEYCGKSADKLNKVSGSRSQFYYTGVDRKNNYIDMFRYYNYDDIYRYY